MTHKGEKGTLRGIDNIIKFGTIKGTIDHYLKDFDEYVEAYVEGRLSYNEWSELLGRGMLPIDLTIDKGCDCPNEPTVRLGLTPIIPDKENEFVMRVYKSSLDAAKGTPTKKSDQLEEGERQI